MSVRDLQIFECNPQAFNFPIKLLIYIKSLFLSTFGVDFLSIKNTFRELYADKIRFYKLYKRSWMDNTYPYIGL